MNTDSAKDILKRIISPIILYIVHLMILAFSVRFNNENMMIMFCTGLAILIIPFYNKVILKFSFFENDNIEYFSISSAIFFGTGTLFCLIDLWLGVAALFISAYMYIIGNIIYILGQYIIYNIKNGMSEGMLKRALSVLIGFPLYLLIALIPMSWIERIKIDYFSACFLFYFFTASIVTGIFRFISGRFIKVSYEKVDDHILFVSFFCITAVLSLTLNSDFDLIREEISGLILVYSVKTLFVYIVGNMGYYVWSNEIKGKKRSITGDSEKEEKQGER